MFSCWLSTVATDAFGYIFYRVGENEIGVVLKESRVSQVIGPGIYNDPFNAWANIVTVKVEGLRFVAEDPELITRDTQRIGVRVSGTVHRPNVDKAPTYFELWSQYRTIFVDDAALVGTVREDGTHTDSTMTDLSKQSMKVCVGERTFDEAVIGEARNDLAKCIEDALNVRVASFGLVVRNVTVPNVIISPEVQKKLDEITEAKFATQKAQQDALKVAAEADREQAAQEGAIQVEQSKIQETFRQETISADLERQQIEADLAVIQAEKANELEKARLDKAVQEAELEVELVKAQIQVAPETAKAQLLQANPEYAEYLIAQTWSGAWQKTDKVIVPAGTNVSSVLNPNSGDMTTVVDAGN